MFDIHPCACTVDAVTSTNGDTLRPIYRVLLQFTGGDTITALAYSAPYQAHGRRWDAHWLDPEDGGLALEKVTWSALTFLAYEIVDPLTLTGRVHAAAARDENETRALHVARRAAFQRDRETAVRGV